MELKSEEKLGFFSSRRSTVNPTETIVAVMVIEMYLNSATITVCALKILVILNLMYTFYIINLQKIYLNLQKHEINIFCRSLFFFLAIQPDPKQRCPSTLSLFYAKTSTLFIKPSLASRFVIENTAACDLTKLLHT